MGRGHRGAIGTLIERTTRFVMLLDLVDRFDAERVNAELVRQLARPT